MNIFEAIENYHLDKEYLTPDIRRHILNSYSLDQWLRLIRVFLKGLDSQHLVPGKDIQRLYDYLNYYREREQLTWEQQWHVLAIVIENWHQMTCESRANLLL